MRSNGRKPLFQQRSRSFMSASSQSQYIYISPDFYCAMTCNFAVCYQQAPFVGRSGGVGIRECLRKVAIPALSMRQRNFSDFIVHEPEAQYNCGTNLFISSYSGLQFGYAWEKKFINTKMVSVELNFPLVRPAISKLAGKVSNPSNIRALFSA
jgi:hypothetical protein